MHAQNEVEQSSVVLSSEKNDADSNSENTEGTSTAKPVPTSGHPVQPGDTLWTITQRYFSSPYEWPRVWSYNPEITNPNWIYPGTSVRLEPSSEEKKPFPIEKKTVLSKYFLPRSKNEILFQHEGFLDKDAIKEVGTIGGSTVDHMFLSDTDPVYIQFGKNAHPTVGQEYSVFRTAALKEHDPDAKFPGKLVKISGAVKITSMDRKTGVAEAEIIESLEPIERGFSVGPIERKFRLQEPVPSQKAIQAKVVAAIHPYQLLAEYQIVFLNVGTKSGVHEGNRFWVVRRGDEWRRELLGKETDMGTTLNRTTKEPKTYPEEVIAEARVVHVRPNTSAAIVTGTIKPVDLGDVARTRAGY